MKKTTLPLLLLFVAVVSTWGQSTFTVLPKFQIGDTLVYEASSVNNESFKEILPSAVNPSNRKFYLVVKGTDNDGNLKVDYLMKEVKTVEKTELLKEMPLIGEVEKFFKEDMLKNPLRLTLDRAGRLQGIDNKDELTELYFQRILPAILDIAMKGKKHRPTAKEIQEVKESLKDEIDIMDIFEEVPALFKYYGQPLMEGKSETVDSVTTKYVVARMGDGTTWLKTNTDLMHGSEEVEEINPGEEFLEDSGAATDDEEGDEGFDLGITATQIEDYKYSKEGIVTYLKLVVSLGSKDISEPNSAYTGGTEVKLIEIKKGSRKV
ncbi:hypothetical protein [Prevotella falsenii]|uniref:hypothetical protein n=1 Tax=Prevotella falsenii TaxID=515414 RepID=UPI000468F203|nr:hypothetical protein [Prevotella falsenii]